MQIILLENINKLGKIGNVVKVRDGFARNFLIPNKKAVRATQDNIAFFEKQRAILEQQDFEKKKEAEVTLEKINGFNITLCRQASDDGKLYGSVLTKNIADALSEKSGYHVDPSCIILDNKIKEIGVYPITIQLHLDVAASVTLTITRSEEAIETATTISEAL